MLLVLGVFAAVGLAVCCGMGTLAYVAVQSVANTGVTVELSPRRDVFEQDAARFNRSLADLQEDPCDDSGICEFVRRSVAAGNQGDSIPFSRSMFIEAIAKSEYSNGRFGVADRLSVSTWLTDSEPEPDTEDFYRILQIHNDAGSDLASVDMVFYSADSQCESYQWFVVRENGNWKVYDWQRMEYGRRMSDEYAGYVQGASPRAEGYDEVMAKLGDAQQLWEDGETEAAKNELLACEQTPMLAGDLPVAQLRIAYMWLAWNENEQTIRVLESIQAPDKRWGIWPVLAMAYMNTDDHETALQIAEKARQQSPQHPNLFWLLSEIYDGLERTGEAAEAAVRAFVICSEDITLLNNVVFYDRPEDIPLLLNVLTESQMEAGWSRVLNQATYSTAWGKALVEQLALHENVPLGAAEIAAGNLAWSQEEYDSAAQHFAIAKRTADLAFLQEMATSDYLYARMEESRFAELFAESDDIDATLVELVKLAYDDEFYADETKLLEAIEQQESLSENVWAAALRGWVYFTTEQPEPALQEFIRFADWLQVNEDALEEDDQWLVNTADYYIAESLLDLKRPLDLLARWPEDRDRHNQLGTQLLRLRERSTIDDFLKTTTDSSVDSVRLQRLRMMAELAFRDDQPAECDRIHQQVDEMARQVYDEEQDYPFADLHWRRTRDLVWASRLPDRMAGVAAVFAMKDGEQREQLVRQAAQQALDAQDPYFLSGCIPQATAAGILEGELLADLQADIGLLNLREGQYAKAIDALQVSFANTPDDERWTREQRRESLLNAMLRSRKFDQARAFASEQPSEYEDVIPTVAVVDLARGEEQALRGYYKANDQQSKIAFGDWLSETGHRRWLEAYADQAWFDRLIRDVTMSIRTQQDEAAGTLLFAAEASFSESDVDKFLQAAAGKPFRLTAVTLNTESTDSQAWLAESEDGQRLVINSYLATCHNQGLQIENAIALLDNVRALTITVLDTQPQSVRRLFAVAAAAAQSDAIGFWYESESWLWMQPGLSQQLEWSERLPVGPHVASNPIFSLEPQQATDSQEYIDIEQWAQRLKASDGPLSVILTLSCGSVSETVPCVIEDVDVEGYDVFVRPIANSLLFPWIKQGVRYSAGAGFVHEQPSNNP